VYIIIFDNLWNANFINVDSDKYPSSKLLYDVKDIYSMLPPWPQKKMRARACSSTVYCTADPKAVLHLNHAGPHLQRYRYSTHSDASDETETKQ
jgi:hypothetical protein